jgi:hypothetical protein
MKISDIPNEKMLELAGSHVSHFQNLIRRGQGIRIDECEMYLDIWRSVELKVNRALRDGRALDNLSVEESGEIQDAINCGDYDELLGIEYPEELN